MNVPKLNFSQFNKDLQTKCNIGTNIPSIPTKLKAKEESHFVYFCIPFNCNQQEFNEIQQNIEHKFGEGTKIIQISNGQYEKLVIQPPFLNNNKTNVIPTLTTIDEAYQTIKHMPYILDNISIQQANLLKEIDKFILENDKLQQDKEKLEIENSLLLQEIKRLECESQNLTKWGENVKKSFDKMMDKL